jgi:hypothetical protein
MPYLTATSNTESMSSITEIFEYPLIIAMLYAVAILAVLIAVLFIQNLPRMYRLPFYCILMLGALFLTHVIPNGVSLIFVTLAAAGLAISAFRVD